MLLPLVFALALQSPSDDARGPAAIAELRAAWGREGGATWGRSLAGPTLFVDPASRRVYATEADAEGRLSAEGGCFTGVLPPDVVIANTALTWAGRRWSMVCLPLPSDAEARGALLLHESWHRVQPDLGLAVKELPCGHLDQLEGRYGLQMEWRALARALASEGEARGRWIRAALAFRAQRRARFPGSAAAERSLELGEGLAEYTGVRTAGSRTEILRRLQREQGPFARSFAYTTGPAYGLLLDEAASGWTRGVTGETDLAERLGTALRLRPLGGEPLRVAAEALGGPILHRAEVQREEARAKRLALIRAQYIEGPTLLVPGPFRLQFNPSNTEALEDGSAFHPTATYLGDWGRLEVAEGSLRAGDWRSTRVLPPADPQARPLRGPGWALDLAPGWTLEAAAPAGSWRLVRAAASPGGR